VKKFLKNFSLHFGAFIEILNPHSRSPFFLKPFLKKPHPMEMAPLRKSASQTTAVTSKGKSMVAGGAGPIDAHPPHLDVHI